MSDEAAIEDEAPTLSTLPAELLIEVLFHCECEFGIVSLAAACTAFRRVLTSPVAGAASPLDRQLAALYAGRDWAPSVLPDSLRDLTSWHRPGGGPPAVSAQSRTFQRGRWQQGPIQRPPAHCALRFTVGPDGIFKSLRTAVYAAFNLKLPSEGMLSTGQPITLVVTGNLDEGPEPIDLSPAEGSAPLEGGFDASRRLRIVGARTADGSRPILRARLRAKEAEAAPGAEAAERAEPRDRLSPTTERGSISHLVLELPSEGGGVGGGGGGDAAAAAATAAGIAAAGNGELWWQAGGDAAADAEGHVDSGAERCLTVGGGASSAWTLEDTEARGGVRVGGAASLFMINVRLTSVRRPPEHPLRAASGLIVQGQARAVVRACHIDGHVRSGVTVQHRARCWLHHSLVSANGLCGVKLVAHARCVRRRPLFALPAGGSGYLPTRGARAPL